MIFQHWPAAIVVAGLFLTLIWVSAILYGAASLIMGS